MSHFRGKSFAFVASVVGAALMTGAVAAQTAAPAPAANARAANAPPATEQRLGSQRSPTTAPILCQPPVNRRTIDANNTSNNFRAFAILHTAHRTLTHRLQRRVIQPSGIILSHAQRESYSPRHVKNKVYLLMY